MSGFWAWIRGKKKDEKRKDSPLPEDNYPYWLYQSQAPIDADGGVGSFHWPHHDTSSHSAADIAPADSGSHSCGAASCGSSCGGGGD